jgi:hypothetical protein
MQKMSADFRAAMKIFDTFRRMGVSALVLVSVCAHADDDCETPMAEWQPRAAVEQLAQRSGWQIHTLKIDDGCYELKGRDAEGYRFKAKLDPGTLDIVSLKRKGPGREHGGAADDNQ